MEPALNPYRPGAGLRPPELAGRDELIKQFDFLIIRAKHRTIDRGMIMSGLRGVGKTALLSQFLSMADQANWITVSAEGQTGGYGATQVRRRLGVAIHAALVRSSVRSRFKSGIDKLAELVSGFTLTVGPVELSKQPSPAATGLLDLDIETLAVEIASAARDHECAFAIFVDEMQDLDADLLCALIVAEHKTQQMGLPFYVIGTGLPNLPAVLSSARSYAERLFSYAVVGPLDESAATEALVVPAQRTGCDFAAPAVAHLVEASNGYPYFLQEYGKAIWDLAETKTFTLDDARHAVTVGQAQLDAGFFPARWERASAKERAYMIAMTDTTQTSGIADAMGQRSAELSPTRQSLINKGLIYAPERGRVAFTVPGMADYIRRATVQEPERRPDGAE